MSRNKYSLLQPESFGEWLTETRRSKGISRRTLADMAGVDITSIAKYELYGHSPSLIYFNQIIGALGLMIVIKEIDDGEKK